MDCTSRGTLINHIARLCCFLNVTKRQVAKLLWSDIDEYKECVESKGRMKSAGFFLLSSRSHSVIGAAESWRYTFLFSLMLPSTIARCKDSNSGFVEATFDIDEVVIGKQLGSGGISEVFEIDAIRQIHRFRYQVEDEVGFARDFMARQVRMGRLKESRYVIKMLRKDSDFNASALADLRSEAEILRSVDHPSIVKLRGVALIDDTLTNSQCSERNGLYFLLLDKVSQTLDERIEAWKKSNERLSHPALKALVDKRGVKRRHLFVERLQVAVDIADTMEYLHLQNIVHGDLEPGNIGFDCRGNVKVFDFNLARKVKLSDGMSFDDFNIREIGVEKLPYISPEVFERRIIRKSSDVYSIAFILHNILSLEKPFSGWLTHHKFLSQVIQNGERPNIDQSWPSSIRYLLTLAWDPNDQTRPSIATFRKVLDDELRICKGARFSADVEYLLRKRMDAIVPNKSQELPSKAYTKLHLDSTLKGGSSTHGTSSIHSRTRFPSPVRSKSPVRPKLR